MICKHTLTSFLRPLALRLVAVYTPLFSWADDASSHWKANRQTCKDGPGLTWGGSHEVPGEQRS